MTTERAGRRPVRTGAGVLLAALMSTGCAGTSHAATSPRAGSPVTPEATTTAITSAQADRPSIPSAHAGRPRAVTPIARFRCPAATVRVFTAPQLRQALGRARPGQVITLADGTYTGSFSASASGTTAAPVMLCGGRGAILQGTSTSTGYVLHLQRASHWRISGFTLRNAQKGVVLDGAGDVGLQDLLVEHLGEEGVHLRTNSTGDVVRGLTIHDTGLLNAQYGEGVYIGTARNNWGALTGGQPDRSDHDAIVENTISTTTAESIDVKEGTTGGLIADNRFDGTGMTAATAWVNVKGNAWTVTGNDGTSSPRDGFQTHVILAGWGERNRFSANAAHLTPGTNGIGVRVQDRANNVVGCSNTVTGGPPISSLGCDPTA
jgi:hypothetical protein